ncbi:MAG: hypothetical protein WBQ14_09670 [Gaiellaceae bacterium]
MLILAAALPFFLIAGWSILAWALAAALWAGVEALNLVSIRLASHEAGLKAVGLAGLVRMSRLFTIAIVLAAVVKLNSDLVLPLIVVFALAYTSELAVSLVSYFGNEPL